MIFALSSNSNKITSTSSAILFAAGAVSGIASSFAAIFVYYNVVRRRRCAGLKSSIQNPNTNNTYSAATTECSSSSEEYSPYGSSIPLPRAGILLRLESDHDDIYERHGPRPFQFNYEVVRVFDDMISRSVPFYKECMVTLVHWIAAQFINRSSKAPLVIYDLGCSTGTTIDFIAQSFLDSKNNSSTTNSTFKNRISFVGVDNSQAMIETAEKKLSWISNIPNASLSLLQQDILHTDIEGASVVILNYTLQFIPVGKRKQLLTQIYEGLTTSGEGDYGILYLSEKVRSSHGHFQEICTQIYEDFKFYRGYSKTEIFRKKEALMNILVPYTEEELLNILMKEVGFDHAQVIVKWNNFTTIVALKKKKKQKKKKQKLKSDSNSHCIETLFYDSVSYNNSTMYMNLYINEKDGTKKKAAIQFLNNYREQFFQKNLKRAANNYESLAEQLYKLSTTTQLFSHNKGTKNFWVDENSSVLCIGGDRANIAKTCKENDGRHQQDMELLNDLLNKMKPWKKGPLQIFGTFIDTEWRSDWKWNRLKDHIDSLDGHVVADLGCANGYFMFRMLLDFQPKLIVGIDPNYKAWLEFLFLQKCVNSDALVFELMDGECMEKYACMYDTVFCLGVLYHTPDPIGMLRKIWKSMKPNGQLIVDCQGIPGDDDVALFPKDKYANAKGMWFLPTVSTLTHWLARSNFVKITVFYSEPLSTEEQRATEWASIKSLNEALDDSSGLTATVEGYPAPYRFYVKCYRG